MRTAAWFLAVLLGLALVGATAFVGGPVGLLVGMIVFAGIAATVLRAVAPGSEAGEDQAQPREVLDLAPGEHPDVAPTGRESAGEPVYETRVDGRTVTAEAVHTDTGRAVRVATPLRVTRPGVGLRLREKRGRLVTVGHGPSDVPAGDPERLLRRVRRAMLELRTVGDLTVDDRLGTVEHVVAGLDDAEQVRQQAHAVVDVARTVEAAVDGAGDGTGADGGVTDGLGHSADQRAVEREGSGQTE